ncbi:MAG: hypothetical protein EHM61_17430 [Acidobacteria bacterium]|nr:MAG: hypothetical protein EHM61_17430 [Acidobacteriota bacterium]
MKRRRLLLPVLVLGALTVMANAQSKQWLHVRVDSAKKGGETVNVNLPLALAETVLPLIKEKEVSGGKIRFDHHNEITTQDLRKIWASVKDQGDAEYVTVQTSDMNLRVAMEGQYLVVRTDETSKNQVQVTLPAKVVDALLSGPEDTLDLLAAVRALSESGTRELVSIKDDDTNVKVWIDDKNVSSK